MPPQPGPHDALMHSPGELPRNQPGSAVSSGYHGLFVICGCHILELNHLIVRIRNPTQSKDHICRSTTITIAVPEEMLRGPLRGSRMLYRPPNNRILFCHRVRLPSHPVLQLLGLFSVSFGDACFGSLTWDGEWVDQVSFKYLQRPASCHFSGAVQRFRHVHI